MALEWLGRDNALKDHQLFDSRHFGKDAPPVVYEERPAADKQGKVADGLYTAWIWLNNPAQYNSYTTEMVKGVIAGFQKAQEARNVVAVVFTGAGTAAFCTGGNTKEYSEYYSQKP